MTSLFFLQQHKKVTLTSNLAMKWNPVDSDDSLLEKITQLLIKLTRSDSPRHYEKPNDTKSTSQKFRLKVTRRSIHERAGYV